MWCNERAEGWTNGKYNCTRGYEPYYEKNLRPHERLLLHVIEYVKMQFPKANIVKVRRTDIHCHRMGVLNDCFECFKYEYVNGSS